MGWCIMYTWIRLLVLIYSFILVFFLSHSKTLKILSLFYEAYTVTWAIDCFIVYTKSSSQYILVLFFFFLFVSLQLANIKNLHLQNCFNIPLMAMAGGMWALLTVCNISDRAKIYLPTFCLFCSLFVDAVGYYYHSCYAGTNPSVTRDRQQFIAQNG